MGGLGSDATIETADVVIQDDMPSKIPMAINKPTETTMDGIDYQFRFLWIGNVVRYFFQLNGISSG
jgi:cation transport ATPase